MILLNTCPQQTLTGDFPGVKIFNLTTRPTSLGAARNLAVAMADEGLIVTLDDDDMALPHYLSVFAELWQQKPEAQWIWADKQFYLEGGRIKKIAMGMMNTFVYTRKAWEEIGGYDFLNVGEDRNFAGKVTQHFEGIRATITPEQTGYLYCWANGVYHISGLGDDKPQQMNAWERARRDLEMKFIRGTAKKGKIALNPKWLRDYSSMAAAFINSGTTPDKPKPTVCMVELGRYGDIINILPVARIIAESYGKPAFMVSREFADVLDGVSYVIPHPVELPYGEIGHAMITASREYPVALRCQIWGNGLNQPRETEAYNLESWRAVGLQEAFYKFNPPLFDKRNLEREAAIFQKLTDGRPMLLLKLHEGHSSPFAIGAELEKLIRSRFEERFQVIELTTTKCERIYDLLGLMDRAVALVSIDTSILHLAAASTIPTIALTNSGPWVGTKPRCNVCHRFHYNQISANPEAIIPAIEDALRMSIPTSPSTELRTPIARKVFHAVERHQDQRESRKEEAWRTWDVAYKRGVIPCHYSRYERDARSIGDKRALPFLKDVLSLAMTQADDEDIIMFTNDDNILHPALPEVLKFHVSVYGACSSQRCEFRSKPPSPADPPDRWARLGSPHMGRDLFAFTKLWLVKHWNDIPDFILGASDWDLALAAFIRVEKGIVTDRKNIMTSMFPAELNRGLVAHIYHPPKWSHPSNHMTAPSQKHNRRLFREWAEKLSLKLHFNKDNVI